VPENITDETFLEAMRAFHGLPLDHPARGQVRRSLVRYLAGQTPAVLALSDYEKLVAHFASVTSLFAPEDFSRGDLPREAEPLAERIVALGSR
jgi:hypothetical protein